MEKGSGEPLPYFLDARTGIATRRAVARYLAGAGAGTGVEADAPVAGVAALTGADIRTGFDSSAP
jgi:hypothetical protein